MGKRAASEEEKWREINENWWLRRFLRSKWKIPIIAILIAIIILSLLSFEILPETYGNHFISVKWFGSPVQQYKLTMNVSMLNWTNTPCSYFAVAYVEIYNRYFIPVYIHGNEFREVILVYNRTVNNPQDIEVNRRYLVWGAYWVNSPHSLEDKTAYEYYATHSSLNNYTVSIPPGYSKWGSGFGLSIFAPVWYGQNLDGKPVPIGTYYLYYIYHGIVASPAPLEINVTAVYR